MNPPNAPIQISPPASGLFHVSVAAAISNNNASPVLFTVPWMVMALAASALPSSIKTLEVRAGLPDLSAKCRAIEYLSEVV